MTAESQSGAYRAFAQEVPDDVLVAWLRPCGSCDAGLPMACTCPTSDPRSVIAALVNERDALVTMLYERGRTPSDARGGSPLPPSGNAPSQP